MRYFWDAIELRGQTFFSLSKNGWHFSFEWKFLTQQWLSRDPFLKWTPENSTWPKWQIMAELVVEFQINVIKFYGFVYTARPRDTRFLVPEKNRPAQNRTSKYGWHFFIWMEISHATMTLKGPILKMNSRKFQLTKMVGYVRIGCGVSNKYIKV